MALGTIIFEIDPALTGVSQTDNTAVANFTELGSEGLTVGSVSDFNGSYDSTSFPPALWMADGGAAINHKPYLKFRVAATYSQNLCFGGAGGVGPQTIATALQGDNTVTFLIRTADISQYCAIFAPHNAATGLNYMGNASIANGYHKTYTGLDETCGVCQIGQGGIGPTPQTGHWLINTWALVKFVTTWKTHSVEVGVFLNGFKQYTAIMAHAAYTNSGCDYIALNGAGYLVGNAWGSYDFARMIIRNAAMTDAEAAADDAALIANYVFTAVDQASSVYPVIMGDSITANYPWPAYAQSKMKQLLGRDVIIPGIGVGGSRLEAAAYGSNNYNVWGAATTLSDISDRFIAINPAITQYQIAIGVNDTYNGLGSGGVINRANFATYMEDWCTNHILSVTGKSVMIHYNSVAWEFTQGVGNGVDVAGNWSSTNIIAVNRGISDAVTALASSRVTLGDTTVEADSLASFAGAHPWTAQDDVHPVDPYGTVGLALPRATALATQVNLPAPTIAQSGTTITVSDSDGAALLYYTTNATNPTNASTAIANGGTVTGVPVGTDFRAIAYKAGVYSSVAQYTTVALPGLLTTLTAAPQGSNTIRISRGTAPNASTYSLYDNGSLVTAAMGATYDITDSNLALPHTYSVKGVNTGGAGPAKSLTLGGSSGTGTSRRVAGRHLPPIRY